MKEEFCYIRGEDLWAVPIKNSDSGAGVNDRIPKMNFRRREVKDGGDTKSD